MKLEDGSLGCRGREKQVVGNMGKGQFGLTLRKSKCS